MPSVTCYNDMTNHLSGEAHNPAISNDGNWIIYEHDGTLHIMDATCTASCPSTSLDTAGELPAWSPDGTQLAFSYNNDIYTATVDYTSNPPLLNLSFGKVGDLSRSC